MASATLMNRFAKSVSKIGSGFFNSPIVAIVRMVVEVITSRRHDLMRSQFPRSQHFFGAYLSNEVYRYVGVMIPKISCRPRQR